MKLITLIVLFATLAFAVAQIEQAASVKERLMKYREAQYDQQPQSMEAVREHHERRLTRLEEMLQERKQSLKDHKSGRRLLKDDEHERFTRQIEIFQRKLEQLRKMTDEDHREMLEAERTSFQHLKRLDYLDF